MKQEFVLQSGNLRIPCQLTMPAGQVRRLVLGVHGFGGCMDDEIQAGIAEEMTLFYAAVMRFEFPSHGSSTMGSQDFTLENCTASLLCAARYLRQRYPQVEVELKSCTLKGLEDELLKGSCDISFIMSNILKRRCKHV